MDERIEDHVPTPRELSADEEERLGSGSSYIQLARRSESRQTWKELNWRGSLAAYLAEVRRRPELARNAYQRIYDMILSFGVEVPPPGSDQPVHYRFFEDVFDGGRDAIFGIERSLAQLVSHLRAAAHGLGPERRVLLLHGPVGSSKSTIARLLKRGLERLSRQPDGAIFSYRWLVDGEVHACPMHEDPLHLLPADVLARVYADLNARFDGDYRLRPTGQLCPLCRHYHDRIMRESGGDFTAVERAVEVYRFMLSEQDRVGIGTFQPKDEKNQDSTELTGDINYRLIAEYGSDSDPRAFNFDGEFHVANRGMIEFVELLKLDVAFLYDLLGATQEQVVKPKKFAQTDIDEVILGHTNSPEYRRLQGNELMEAFRDRTTKIDIPYNRRLSDEVRIYEKSFGRTSCAGRHLAPHAIEAAAMFAVLSRLEEPKNASLSLVQKMYLYDGRLVGGFNESTAEELRREAPEEGMTGISPRYVQDRMAAALVADGVPPCLLPFDVLDSLEEGLEHHPLMDSDEVRRALREVAALVREEVEETIKNEVREAVVADVEAVRRLCCNYVDAVSESVRGEGPGDERLMRSIEEKIGVTESRKADFRREIVNYIDALATRGESFTYMSNPRLRSALELKLFEDSRDTFKLTAASSTVVDRDVLEKVELVAARLVREKGYCEACAARTLDHVAGLFARGDPKVEPEEGGMTSTVGRIARDRRRFEEIVRGQIKRNLKRYVTGSEMIGRRGKQLVSIPVPRIELPRLRFGSNGRGQGGGDGDGQGEGGSGEGQSVGTAGAEPGAHLLEVELRLEEMAAILGEELELPNIQPRGRARVEVTSRRYSSVSRQGPRSLRHMRRTLKEALKRQIGTGEYDPDNPRIAPVADDLRFRTFKEVSTPDHAAMILYMMDVSGSMGREQKEIVRLVSFWIDTWLRSQYRSLETRYMVHDAAAKEVDQDTFYRLRESGGTKISSAYALAAELIEKSFPASDWNVYLFHFSDGDNWSGRDTEKCLSLLREQLLPAANMFCYGQVKSAYGSGQFMKDLNQALGEHPGVIHCEILDREGILPAIKTFLGKGL